MVLGKFRPALPNGFNQSLKNIFKTFFDLAISLPPSLIMLFQMSRCGSQHSFSFEHHVFFKVRKISNISIFALRRDQGCW